MANLLRSTPHAVLPGVLTPQVQNVDFEKYVAGSTRQGKDADNYLYVNAIDNIHSEVFIGQQWGSDLSRSLYNIGQIQAPYYRIESYMEYDVYEQANFESIINGYSLPAFLEDLARQGINQKKHQAILYGFDNSEGLSQGIIANETVSTMPADSKGKTTLVEYDIGELQSFLTNLARQVMDNSFNMSKPVVFSSSNRVINYIKTAIVPISQFIQGGGVASIGQVYDTTVSEWLGVGKIQWIADNLLMNASSDGTKDVIRIIAPGLDPQEQFADDVDQNLVGNNSILFNTFYDKSEGLKRFDAPPALGKYSCKFVYKMTPGISLRKEAVISTEIKYS